MQPFRLSAAYNDINIDTMNKRKYLIVLLLCALSISVFAQRTGVREEVLADWNKASGLDCLYDLSPKAGTAAPKGYEAIYISHYGRHGSRYAYTSKAYTVLMNMLAEARIQDNLTPYGEDLLNRLQPFWDTVQYRVGDLSPLGWEQHQAIAETMVKSFPSAFGKGSVVDACSSPAVRSVVSMSSCCGAISRLAPQASVYAHQSQTDVQATRPNSGYNPLRYSGPKDVFPYPESSEGFFLRRFPQYKDVFARLFKDPDNCLGDRNPYDVFFNLYMFVAGMNSLPENERLDVEGLLTHEEFATLWEIDNYERVREYRPYRTSCTSIVDDMLVKADERLSSGKRGADLRFGHDHVLMALLMIMDIDGFDYFPASADELVYYFQSFRSPMAANIQYVFFAPRKNGKGDILVKVLLNGEEARLGNLAPVQGPYYRWADVRDYLKQRGRLYVDRPEEKGWSTKEIAPGLVYREFQGTEPASGAAQHVFIADWDMSVPGFALKFNYSPTSIVTSKVMKDKGAVVAMNAAYEPESVVLKVDGAVISMMPNNKIMTTPAPNWKSEGSVCLDGDKVKISYDGKGLDLGGQRRFYSSCTASGIFTSAPMLIDDYQPVGESFAGYYSDREIESFNYEDPRRHQGVRHPRTAVAITADNHFLMVVVDGRRPGISEGMSARELTRFLKSNFNPRYALNMDGGGSSTLCVEGLGDPNTHVVNYPTGNKRYDHAGERYLYSHFYLVRE